MTSQLRTVSVTTSYAPLPDLSCSRVSILNRTSNDLQVRIASETQANQYINLPTALSVAVQARNAKFIEIKAASAAANTIHLVIDP